MSLTLAAVVVSVCTRPESLSTPMCAFMPKCHWLPFLAWCISGSRACSLFFVELGAAIKVASTSVPWVMALGQPLKRPRSISMMLTSTSMALVKSWASSRWRNPIRVVASGTLVRLRSMPMKLRSAAES